MPLNVFIYNVEMGGGGGVADPVCSGVEML